MTRCVPVALLALAACGRSNVSGKPDEPMVRHNLLLSLADSNRQTEQDMLICLSILSLYEAETGRAPTGLQDVFWKAPENYGRSSVIRDAWGTQFRLQIVEDSVRLQAAGADMTFDSDDDLWESLARPRLNTRERDADR